MSDIFILADAAQIVTPASNVKPQRGNQMGKLQIWKNCSISIDAKFGIIREIGPWKKIRKPGAKTVDAKGFLILPGFVDSHTHPIYAGTRVNEFFLRAQGKGYMEILKAGGGIFSTVRATRKASDDELFQRTHEIFNLMLAHGTTTVEAKSGYGLSTLEEIRHLEILQKVKKHTKLEIFTTFLGAHVIPPEYKKKPAEYVNLVCHEMIPRVSRKKLADFCDVFCEKGVFSPSQSRKILEAARKAGLGIRLHADEFEDLGGAALGASLRALSADHLMGISQAGIRALASSDTAAVLLPCTSFFLGKGKYAPARALIDAGAVAALATDFNAGSNLSFSMQMAASLGVLQMKLSPEEALVASTLHGAYALGISERAGSLHPGKEADLVLYPGSDYREIFYRYGTNQARQVFKNGKEVK